MTHISEYPGLDYIEYLLSILENREYDKNSERSEILEELRKCMNREMKQIRAKTLDRRQSIVTRYALLHRQQEKDKISLSTMESRKFKMVDPSLDGEKIKTLTDAGGTVSDLIAFKTLDSKRDAYRDTLAYVENRHRDILIIEREMSELARLFEEFAILTTFQGESVDIISDNVENAKNSVVSGVGELRKANKLLRKWN